MIIADVTMGRSAHKPVVIFGKAARNDDDQVVGVYFLTLDLDWLARDPAMASLPVGARLSVIDGNGFVAARFPDPEGLVGQRVLDSPIVRQVLGARGEGSLEDVDRLGELRLVAHVPLLTTTSGSNYHLLLSVPRETVVGPAWRNALHNFAVLLAVLARWQR